MTEINTNLQEVNNEATSENQENTFHNINLGKQGQAVNKAGNGSSGDNNSTSFLSPFNMTSDSLW